MEYMPFFDRSLNFSLEPADCMYVHNDFVKPGRHFYFVVVFGEAGSTKFKKHFDTFVKPRKEEISYQALPKVEQEESAQIFQKKSQYPDLIYNVWKFDHKVIEQEVALDIEALNITKLMKQEEYEKV